jgi:hypothetical protein
MFNGIRGYCRAATQSAHVARALLTFLVLLAYPLALHAQTYNGSITGTVTDASGAAVRNAHVTVVNAATNNVSTAITSAQGSYVIPQLPIGAYVLHVESANFKEFVSTGVEVHTATATEVNAALQVGAISEKVTVEANAVQVQTASAEVGEVIDGTQVRELPLNGENFVGLTQLSPGVSAASNYDGVD